MNEYYIKNKEKILEQQKEIRQKRTKFKKLPLEQRNIENRNKMVRGLI